MLQSLANQQLYYKRRLNSKSNRLDTNEFGEPTVKPFLRRLIRWLNMAREKQLLDTWQPLIMLHKKKQIEDSTKS